MNDPSNLNDNHPAPQTLEEAERILSQMADRAEQPQTQRGSQFAPLEPPSINTKSLEESANAAAHESLLAADARYRALVEQIPAITFMASLGGGENELYVSPHIETMLGFTQEEWLSDPFLWYRQLHPDDRTRWHDEFAKTCAMGVHFKSEYRFLSRDGATVWVHGEARVIRDSRGAPLFLHGIAFDITEGKRAEQVLRDAQRLLEQRVEERTAELRASQVELLQSSRMLAAIVDNAVDAIITIDEHCVIHSANDAAEHIFGYTENEVLGQNVKMLMPSPYRDSHDTYVQNYIRTGSRKIIGIGREVVGKRKDGSTFPMELAVSEVKTGDRLLFTGIVRDITARKQAEREVAAARVVAENANRAKGEFLANMSHEIRTPMNGIIGMAELALDTRLTPEQLEYIDTIRESGITLLSIINDILDFSKIEAGKMELDVAPFRLRESINSTFRSLKVRAQQKQLELAWNVAADVPDELIGDSTKINQVIINLVGNAVKFTDEGQVVLDVIVESHAEDSVSLHFSVRDTGMGIPADKLQSIFSAFSQADASITRTHGGTGLGLSISAKIVNLMGGRVWVESVLGEGSVFHFVVPLEISDRAGDGIRADTDRAGNDLLAGNDSAATPQTNAIRSSPLQVLLVEDNAVNQKVAMRLLSKWGHTVSVAANGQEGLDLWQQEPFDVVLMDIQMPIMDGFATTARIREIEANTTKHTPIVAMTAHAMAGDRERCLQAGMDAYISKPINAEALRSLLVEYGSRRRPEHEHPPAAFDRETALMYCDGDEQLLKELAELLLQDAPQIFRNAQQAIRQADADKLSQSVDALIGSFACFGAKRAQQVAQQVAQHALRGDLGNAGQALPELDRCLQDLLDQVDAIIERDEGDATNSSSSP